MKSVYRKNVNILGEIKFRSWIQWVNTTGYQVQIYNYLYYINKSLTYEKIQLNFQDKHWD